MSEPTKPPAFDPRRLADLAARVAPRPVPEEAAPEPSGDPVAQEVERPPAAAANTGPAGHPQIEAVLAELERAERLPPDQQLPVYESVHRTLQETLRSIEQS